MTDSKKLEEIERLRRELKQYREKAETHIAEQDQEIERLIEDNRIMNDALTNGSESLGVPKQYRHWWSILFQRRHRKWALKRWGAMIFQALRQKTRAEKAEAKVHDVERENRLMHAELAGCADRERGHKCMNNVAAIQQGEGEAITEERIKEIYEKHLCKRYKPPTDPEEKRAREEHIDYLMPAFRTVAAEAWKEGIGKMVEAVYQELGGDVDREFLEEIAAERLKEE